jgi:hypothetical protein
MLSLSQDDRQMIKDQHVKQRTTRQNDSKKRNNNDTSSSYYLKDNLMPKKIKSNNSENNTNTNNNDNINKINKKDSIVDMPNLKTNKTNSLGPTKENLSSHLVTTPKKINESIHNTKLFFNNDKENDFPAKLFDDQIIADKCNSNVDIINKPDSLKIDLSKYNFDFDNKKSNILGVGHIHIIHLFTRDFLFNKIKILSDHHLERQGEILKKIMDKLNYSERLNGNYIAFTNAVRTEIRKTMCAKRGYVKRQIGLLLKGMKFLDIYKNCFFMLN